MGTQKLYLAFGLFVITYYHCFKISTFSLWKYCFFVESTLQSRMLSSAQKVFWRIIILWFQYSQHIVNEESWKSVFHIEEVLLQCTRGYHFFLNFRFIKNNKRNCDIHSDVRLLTLMTMLFFFYLPLSKIAYIDVLPDDHISNNKACVTYSSVTQCCNWEI